IRIHKENKELLTGSLMNLGADYNYIAYARMLKGEQVVVLVNNNYNEITKDVSVWEAGVPREYTMQRLLFTHADGYTTEAFEYEVNDGIVRVTLPPTSAIILKAAKKEEPVAEPEVKEENLEENATGESTDAAVEDVATEDVQTEPAAEEMSAWDVASNVYKKAEENKKKKFPFF
ncbi:MAG: hypothetical protein IJD26_02895, partial [Lachnospiraceae bacterium]|nr:hypothetical protein [Lachnospiraceae bacterium]